MLVLVAGWLLVAAAVAVLSRLVVRSGIPGVEDEHIPAIAGPLMPALGATFAVLTAITLASEAGYLRDAQTIVSTEAAAAARLGWAATSPQVDTAPIHAALAEYLRTARGDEWDPSSDRVDPVMAEAIADLEGVVRDEAARTELGTPASTELLASLDALTTARRVRLAAATRDIPALYVVTLVAGGLVLVANAGVLTFRSGARASLLIMGLAGVVGLSLALLFAVTGPWHGALAVSGDPIDDVTRDLDRGFFSPG
jgi:hypothetical protein